MSEGTPHTAMAEANRLQAPQRRRSPRFGSPGVLRGNESKMALGAKRTITVRKIVPRNTAAPSEDNKENTPRRSGNLRQTKLSSPEPDRRTPSVSSAVKRSQRASVPPASLSSSSSAGRRETRQAAAPSPILASPDPEQRDSVWTRKVRRSYSRLSDSSPHSPRKRETLFGFEKLSTPEVVRNRAEHSGTSLEVSGSFVSVLEAEEGCSGPDPNIPGVVVVKEKRRKRKVLPIDTEELEVLAAQMNAEFREAEEFDLVVE
ncbi:sororin isoform X4 [Fundulus heteroclitus]|uniref:sororin isoform X4 n=1 Tax=Fundulus heteroclitus TaxID=8078 RepID=UPI00165A26C8|nr:sororin isoform X4 [Fundulus heteroclitus]